MWLLMSQMLSPGAAAAVEERQVERIGARVVGADEAQQRALAAAVAARDVPPLTRGDAPVEVAEDGARTVGYGGVAQLDDTRS